MRFFSGGLGALVGIIVAFLCANLVQDAMAGGDTFSGGLYFIVTWPFVLLIGIVLGVVLGLRVLRLLQADEADSMTRRKKAAVATGLMLAVAAVVAGLGNADERLTGPPSDDAMLTHFRQSRATLERVVQMAHADKGLDRVGSDWTQPSDPQKIGVSPARVSEYRRLLSGIGVRNGFQTGDTAGEIEFYYWGQGSAISSDYDKGYLYLPKPPAHALSSLDGYCPHGSEPVRVYRRVTDHWYLYYKYLPG